MRYSLLSVVVLFFFGACSGPKLLKKYPHLRDLSTDSLSCHVDADTLRTVGEDYLVRNTAGNWELYVSGEPWSIGLKKGLLSGDLFTYQHDVFVNKLLEDVPSVSKRRWIMRFMRWYNRHLEDYIPEEYLTEIYALSTSLRDVSDGLGVNGYQRTLWMHGAHDLGHVLQDLAIVGCSSFAVWGDKSADGKLLIARNLDFYFNDAFAENKMVYFVRPESGIPFMSVSWAGMVGVLSGMNQEGLTVTMNAGKSSIPLSAKTPISIVAREMLQYASNLDEAIAIAKRMPVFVSESLMVGSAKDNKAMLIELSPRKIDFYEVDNNALVCTNHFQSVSYVDDKRNQKHIAESHSLYRYERLNELLSQNQHVAVTDAVNILRNRHGHGDSTLGMGNDKSLNHLLAHHSIVFQPVDKRVYVSSGAGQMGSFTAYDLDEVFGGDWREHRSFGIDSLAIPADSFLQTEQYANFQAFKQRTEILWEQLQEGEQYVTKEELQHYVELNPDLWLGYYVAGRFFYLQQDYGEALRSFERALSKVIPTADMKLDIEKYRNRAEKKWKKR